MRHYPITVLTSRKNHEDVIHNPTQYAARMTSGGAAAIAATAMAFMLAGCSTPPTATLTPAYRLEEGNKRTDLRVTIGRLYTPREMFAIVEDLQVKYADRDDGYFVRINCSVGGTEHVDNRLANGKFAVGRIGAARTGLDDGDYELSIRPEAHCP